MLTEKSKEQLSVFRKRALGIELTLEESEYYRKYQCDKSYKDLAEYVHAYAQKMQMKREGLSDKGIWIKNGYKKR